MSGLRLSDLNKNYLLTLNCGNSSRKTFSDSTIRRSVL